ncbi:MAG: hypothetical protein ACPKPY_09025 [Nitrososphaeraceae archaeon]
MTDTLSEQEREGQNRRKLLKAGKTITCPICSRCIYPIERDEIERHIEDHTYKQILTNFIYLWISAWNRKQK